MNSEKPEMTTFHLKMDILMMDELTDLDLFQKTQNLSETFNRILLQLFPVIEKEDVEGRQRFSKYRLIHENPDVPRMHVVVKIPVFMYRRLKALHDVLNYYSLAQLVRDLVRLHLNLVGMYGDKYGEVLMKFVNEWIEFHVHCRFLVDYLHQLLKFVGDIEEIIMKFEIYALHFTPIREFRL
jgi:hypothetical protein